MNHKIFAVLLALAAAAAQAADSYGYFALWQNPANEKEPLQVKTTKENATQAEAAAELQAFCRAQDTLAGVPAGGATGCTSVVPLHNSCIAIAYPAAQHRMTDENVVAITSPLFSNVQRLALSQCTKKYGSQGNCELQTAFCTDKNYYGGTVRNLWNRLKTR
ncbi:DUF4189 domain-containing protein [Neisseria chenwenguii]|uniref:Uncharacterized protein n=1 Tax=Neisseria chenwenguii TaxID=1853278 RepID=A0A220S548_9NEIS|nr:DUF4189 domain-containing protein [Neisseria chenwenguii]ASK28577.1 hypothetical protein BG910_11585 [Neisseria chenwenguii]ROV57441.1 DUF4189 domain-containing protein [Neisseria chenwenguii]